MEKEITTLSGTTDIKKGMKIRMFGFGPKKPWYKRFFHFVTFRRFDFYTVVEVKDQTNFTIK